MTLVGDSRSCLMCYSSAFQYLNITYILHLHAFHCWFELDTPQFTILVVHIRLCKKFAKSNPTSYTQPLWSSVHSSWLLIQRSGFDPRHYQIFWEVVGLERGPLSLVSITEELLQRSSGSGLENRDYGADHATPLYQQKLALPSPTSCGSSVGIFLSRTKATELLLV
jgi:hypothetical protein